MRSAGEVSRARASTRRTATSAGGRGSASCCSPGATTASGGSASCSHHLGRYYAPYSTDRIRRPWDADELIEVGRAHRARRQEGRPALRRPAAPARRGDRHRRAARGAVPRRADGGLRPGGAPRVPRPGAPAGRRGQTTILLTTHDLDEAEKLADRILILAGGRIIADGSADELARRISARGRGALDASTASGSCTPRRTRPGSSASCSRSTATAIDDLEVRRASLEDTYMTLVREYESGRAEPRSASSRR